MISKHFSAFCNSCTKTQELYAKTFKLAEIELLDMNWKKVKGEWKCNECLKESNQEKMASVLYLEKLPNKTIKNSRQNNIYVV